MDSSLETKIMCMGNYEMKPHVYVKIKVKIKCVRTNDMLENGLMYLYWASQFNVIYASIK